jgi:peptidylprolyl isomerase
MSVNARLPVERRPCGNTLSVLQLWSRNGPGATSRVVRSGWQKLERGTTVPVVIVGGRRQRAPSTHGCIGAMFAHSERSNDLRGIMAQAKQGDTVRVHYTGTLDNGEEFDSSRETDPLTFTLGEGSVIPGFDSAVTGMRVGDEKRVTIAAEDAYGPYHDELTLRVPREELPADLALEEGTQLRMEQDGEVMIVTVGELDDDFVTLDANHPLAGEQLTFALRLVEIV